MLTFRDEYTRLGLPRKDAEAIASNCYLSEEFLDRERRSGRIGPENFSKETRTIKIHVHCHQKALSDQKMAFDALSIPSNYNTTLIPAGCCGMAGSFGYEKEHYELSMKIGDLKLFPSVRKQGSDVVLVAGGTSCRHQIHDGTGRVAMHPVTILKEALEV